MAKDNTLAGTPADRPNKWGSLTLPWPRLRLGRPRVTRLRLAVLSVAALMLLLWAAIAVRSTSIYSTQVLVVDSEAIGIPPPDERLDFGDIPRGGSVERSIQFQNNGRIPTGVVILEWGSIRDLMSVSDAFFSLDPGDEKRVTFETASPASGEAKKYSGKVIVMRAPWWWP